MRKRKMERRSGGFGPVSAVSDLLTLYNLALAVRGSGDPYAVCIDFVRQAVQHLKLSYGAVWLVEPGVRMEQADFIRFASYPAARDGLDRVPSDHPMPRAVAGGGPIRVIDTAPEFESFAVEPSIRSGVQVLYRLDGVGLLKLYASDPEVLPDSTVTRLYQVIDRFADALRGLFATRRVRQEIGQRMRAEDKLKTARALSNAVLDASPDLIFYKDRRGFILAANKAFKQFWQIGDQSPSAIRADQFVPPDEVATIVEQDKQVLSSGEPAQFVLTVHRKGLEPSELEITRAPVIDEAGKPIGVVGIARDATSRNRTLSELQTRTRALDSLTDGVVVSAHKDGLKVLYANPAFMVMTGMSYDQLIGKDARDIYLFDHDEMILSQVTEAMKNHKPLSCRLTRGRNTERTRVFDVQISPVLNEKGISTHYVAIFKDITKRERLERELQQRQKMDTLGRLASGIAHDFNNMLATILGFSELAEDRARKQGDAQSQDFLDSIRGAAENGRELVSQLLTFSRSVPPVAPTLVNAHEVVTTTLKMVRPLLPSQMSMNLISPQTSLQLAIDAVSLERLLMNLCLNGRDAMDESGTLTIELTTADLTGRECAISLAQLQGSYVALTVSDNGSGISRDIRQRIFEPFFTTKRPTQGTGMGLSVVQGIIKAHQGNILIDHPDAGGTRVTAVFPICDPAGVAAGKEPTAPVIVAQGDMAGRKILVVDDDRQVAAFLRQLFEHAGMEVEVAYDGAQGLHCFQRRPQHFDVLLTDQTMPLMSGVELIRKARELRPDIPCVMLTAYSHFDDGASAAAAGIDRLLRKPTDNSTLLKTVAELL